MFYTVINFYLFLMIIVIVSKNTVTFWLEPQLVNLELTKTVQFRLTLISFSGSKADEKKQKEKKKNHTLLIRKEAHEMACLI